MRKKLVDETPELRMQMDELLVNEFATEEGDNYRLSAKIANGQIELPNGQKNASIYAIRLFNLSSLIHLYLYK